MRGTLWHKVRRITYEILGVKGKFQTSPGRVQSNERQSERRFQQSIIEMSLKAFCHATFQSK